jgi:hypothetical protein
MRSVNIIHPGALAEAEQGRGTRTLFRHALEMTVAMIVGMVVLWCDVPRDPRRGVRDRLR